MTVTGAYVFKGIDIVLKWVSMAKTSWLAAGKSV